MRPRSPLRGDASSSAVRVVPAQRGDDVPQRQQSAVDVDALLEPRPRGFGLLVPLGPGEVHEVELGGRVSFRRIIRQKRLLDDDGEDGVRPRRKRVHLRPAGGARHATELEEAEHLVRGARRDLARAGDDDGAVGAFAYAYASRVGVRMQQVTHLLVVHFQKRASNAHVAGAGFESRARLGEDVRDDARDDAEVVIREIHASRSHRVRLARARLAVREHGRVVPAEARLYQRRDEAIVHLRLRRAGAERVVEAERAALAEHDGVGFRVREALARALDALLRHQGARAHRHAHRQVLHVL